MPNRSKTARESLTAAAAVAALLTAALLATTPADASPRKKAAARTAEAETPAYGRRDDVMRFADDVAARVGLDVAWVQELLAQARFLPAVARAIMPPPAGTAKNWAAYRARFVEPVRIRAGGAFWREHEAWLAQAEQRYGVPPSIVVGILGVETIYGRQMGSFRALDALATLAFDFPPGRRDRSAFFRDELAALFELGAKQQFDPRVLTGSYAGALGLPQFMPSSWLRHAIDFDGDGRVDLLGSPADAIGSVAAYLAAHGWQRGMPTHFEVAPPVEVVDRAIMLVPDILPSFTADQFAERGAALSEAGRRHEGLLALVELQNGDAAPSYVAGTTNFYAITRYNWSSYYALAVIELGAAVAAERGRP